MLITIIILSLLGCSLPSTTSATNMGQVSVASIDSASTLVSRATKIIGNIRANDKTTIDIADFTFSTDKSLSAQAIAGSTIANITNNNTYRIKVRQVSDFANSYLTYVTIEATSQGQLHIYRAWESYGSYDIIWDGRDENSNILPPGSYKVGLYRPTTYRTKGFHTNGGGSSWPEAPTLPGFPDIASGLGRLKGILGKFFLILGAIIIGSQIINKFSRQCNCGGSYTEVNACKQQLLASGEISGLFEVNHVPAVSTYFDKNGTNMPLPDLGIKINLNDNIEDLDFDNGPAILMSKTDHEKTASYLSNTTVYLGLRFTAPQWRKIQHDFLVSYKHHGNSKGFFQAQGMDIAQIEDQIGSEYDECIKDMILYTGDVGLYEDAIP